MKVNDIITEANDGNTGISDDWFKQGSFKTWKKSVPISYEVAKQDGTIKTLEGPVSFKAGFYIVTGPKGEQYPVDPTKFKELYDINSDSKATPKKIIKYAKLADHDGVVSTSWGDDLHYTTGEDYIVRHGAGDYGVVKKDIFAKTYSSDSMNEAYDWEQEEGYDFENPLPIIDDPDIWGEIEDLEGDIIEAWEEETGKSWRETYSGAGAYKKFIKEVSVTENVPISKIICTEKWLSKDHIQRILSGESTKDSLPLIHDVDGQYFATDGNHRIVAAALNGEKSIQCDVVHPPHTTESVDEASYEGNIGIMELIKFKQTAPPAIKKLLDYLIDAGRGREAWKVVQQQTRTNLKGK